LPQKSTLFPYTTLFRSGLSAGTNFTPALAGGNSKLVIEVSGSTAAGSVTFNGFVLAAIMPRIFGMRCSATPFWQLTTTGKKVLLDRKSTRLNSSHVEIS